MMREFLQSYLKENDVKIKDGTDVNAIMRGMMVVSCICAIGSLAYASEKEDDISIKEDYTSTESKTVTVDSEDISEEFSVTQNDIYVVDDNIVLEESDMQQKDDAQNGAEESMMKVPAAIVFS